MPKVWSRLSDALSARWPGPCAACRSWCAGGLCHACLTRFAQPRPRCRSCALPVASGVERCGHCVRARPACGHAVAWVDYGFPWDRLLGDLKFHGHTELASPLARGLTSAVRAASSAHALPDRVIPVPLSSARLRERGYNQAWEIARRVARALDLPADATSLQRWRDTSAQVGLHRDERERNLRDAFLVAPEAALRGQRIALVDDVVTTGATAQAAAQALLAAGAAEVQLWMVARTPAPA